MAKKKSGYDIQINGLKVVYNDTIEQAVKASDIQARKDLTAEADRLALQIREIERQKKWNTPKWSIKHPFTKR
jgi:hypothetical protein